VTAEFTPLSIVEVSGQAAEPKGPPHGRSRELTGRRIRYTYGDGGIYEHVYLTENLFTWHCQAGPEKGLADTDACDCYAIRSDVYLFSWREKIIPTLGVVLVNTGRMRSNGYLTGIDTHTGEVSYFPIGARGELLNVTEMLP
jgi:hypothetical protein